MGRTTMAVTDHTPTETNGSETTNVARLVHEIQVQVVHDIETAGEMSLSELRQYARDHPRFSENPTWAVRLLDVDPSDPDEHMAVADGETLEESIKQAAAGVLVETAIDAVERGRGPIDEYLAA